MDDRDSKLNSPAPAAPTASSFSPWRIFARHWRESVRYFGWWRTLREMVSATWDAFVELLPSRRKAAFGDLDYDWEHSVDTTRSNVGLGTQFLNGVTARPYFATEPWLFEQIMQALAFSTQQSAVSQSPPREALRDFTFIDLGSGKGRVLLMASDYPFKRIIGVEFMPELHRAAQENVREYTERTKATLDDFCGTGTPACAAGMMSDEGTDKSVCATKAASIESLCLDARNFEFPSDPLVVYLFNPFSESTFAHVLENLRRSVEQSPRPVYIAYRFTEHESLLERSDWLEKVEATEQWAVYRNRGFS